ncbi:hypothetical protein R1sor_013160 [Riccia sorocarpa]|uniref:SAP domain-containing protein n=1 Tax=Riccia sorocarpa TaxID=122646 RepID=A0ABD3H7Q9_9MARC
MPPRPRYPSKLSQTPKSGMGAQYEDETHIDDIVMEEVGHIGDESEGASELDVLDLTQVLDSQVQAGREHEVGWITTACDLWENNKRQIQDGLAKKGGNSWKIETATIAKGIELLRGRGVVIAEVIHDENSSIDSLLNGYGILGQKDLWHKCKNVTAKFRELQEKKKSASDCNIDNCGSAEDVALFNVKELKEWLRARGQPVSGNKPELCSRIVTHLQLAESALPLQRARPYAYPKLQANDMAYKLKSWIYTACHGVAKRRDEGTSLLTLDILNGSDHWAGLHEFCRILHDTRKCILPDWDSETCRHYKPNSTTHEAVTTFLTKHITVARMKYYRKARENFLSHAYIIAANVNIRKVCLMATHSTSFPSGKISPITNHWPPIHDDLQKATCGRTLGRLLELRSSRLPSS